MKKRKVTILLVVANLCLLTLYVSGWKFGKAPVPRLQDGGKTVVKHFAPANEPVEVTEPKIKGRDIKLGDIVKEGSDWLKHLTFKVKNKSDAPITFLQVDLDFPETSATGSVMMHQLFIGQSPDIGSTRNNQALRLNPNESISISLEPEYGNIKRLIELRQPPVENINKVVIRLGEVMFEDGRRYSGGSLFRRNPDPGSPRKWVPVWGAEATRQGN